MTQKLSFAGNDWREKVKLIAKMLQDETFEWKTSRLGFPYWDQVYRNLIEIAYETDQPYRISAEETLKKIKELVANV